MKKFYLLNFLSLITILLFSIQATAQETSGDKVTVQISRDGKVIADTVLQMKEGQDPEAVKKVIAHVLEGDIKVTSGKEGHQKMVWVTTEGDKHMWHAEDIDMDMDSVMKHEEKVMVFKGDSVECDHKVIVRKGSAGEEIIIIKSSDHLEISEVGGEGSKIIIIEEKGDKECEGHPKHVKVIVQGDEDEDIEIVEEKDFEWVEKEGEDNVDVYIIKTEDGTEVVKTVKVEVKVDEEEASGNDAAEKSSEKEPAKPEKKNK